MIEEHIDIQTEDGPMNTFIVFPKEAGPHPLIFFYMDAPGKREELHDMARRLASAGYFVVLPNLFYRSSRDFYLKSRTPEALELMYSYMNTLSPKKSHSTGQRINSSRAFSPLSSPASGCSSAILPRFRQGARWKRRKKGKR